MGGKRSLATIISALIASISISCASVRRDEPFTTNSTIERDGEGIVSLVQNPIIIENMGLCLLRDLDEVGEYSGVIDVSGNDLKIITNNSQIGVNNRITLLRDGSFSIIDNLRNDILEKIRSNPEYYLVEDGSSEKLVAQLELVKQSSIAGNRIKKHELEILCDLIASFFDGIGGNDFYVSSNRISFHIHPNNITSPSESDLKIARLRGHELIFSYIPMRAILRIPDSNIIIDKLEACVVLNNGNLIKKQYDISPKIGHLLRIKTAKILATGYLENFDLGLACLESFKEEKINEYHQDNLEDAVTYVGSRLINKILEAIDKSDKEGMEKYKKFFERYKSLCDHLTIQQLRDPELGENSYINQITDSGLAKYSIGFLMVLATAGILLYIRRKKVKL